MGDLLGSPRVAFPSTCLGLKGYVVVVVMIHCVARHSYNMIQTYSTRLITMLNLNTWRGTPLLTCRLIVYPALFVHCYILYLYSYIISALHQFIIHFIFGRIHQLHSWPKCSLPFADTFYGAWLVCLNLFIIFHVWTGCTAVVVQPAKWCMKYSSHFLSDYRYSKCLLSVRRVAFFNGDFWHLAWCCLDLSYV